MQIQKILALIDKLDAKLVVLLCHHNADPDAIGAAFAFKGLLKQLRPNLEAEIAAASGPSRLSKVVMTILPIELVAEPRIEEADLLVLLDTNTIQQLDEWSTRITTDRSLIVIDHHVSHPETEQLATLLVADETASSTCEVVYHLFKEAKLRPSLSEAKALFLGLAFDTRHFVMATSNTLKVVAELVDAGVNAQEALPVLSLSMERSERIARLKASNRLKLLKINRWLIALSRVSTYQASSARGLIVVGANVAIVAGKKDDEIQVSFRASREFFMETGLHMGRDLAKPLGEFLGGMGGGHSISAGANGTGDVNACLDYCSKLIKNKLM
ncbi:bifunctional oligoribonuclease/PAP phosphatase NrnA [Thermoproteota archaeon]